MGDPSTQLISPGESICFEGLKLLEKLLVSGQFVPAKEIKSFLLSGNSVDLAKASLIAKIMHLENACQFLPDLRDCMRYVHQESTNYDDDDDDDDEDDNNSGNWLLNEAVGVNSPQRLKYLLTLGKTLYLFSQSDIVFAARVAAEHGSVECLQLLLNESNFKIKPDIESVTESDSESDKSDNGFLCDEDENDDSNNDSFCDDNKSDDSDNDSFCDEDLDSFVFSEDNFDDHIEWYGRESEDALLYLAARNGKSECVRILLDSGFPVDGSTGSDKTPLFAACLHGHLDVVKILLESGADLNRMARKGIHMILKTRSAGTLECAKELIKAGMSVNCKGPCKQTPLHVAAGVGHAEIATMLIERGANLEAKDIAGWIPLQHAVVYKREELVRILVAAHNDLSAKRESGQSVQELAKSD